jgi:hypothetical protein
MDPNPALFCSSFEDANKNIFLLMAYCRYIYFKDNKSLRSQKTLEVKGFLNFLLVDRRIGSESIQILWIREAQRLTDTASDPEHCCFVC